MSDKCGWTFDDNYSYYDTACENTFMFECDGILQNEFRYCPYCGKAIEEIKPEVMTDDAE
jgi:hypothetical protein